MRWFGRRDRDYREELETHIQMEVRDNLDRGELVVPVAVRNTWANEENADTVQYLPLDC